jgi:VWFA-related protein
VHLTRKSSRITALAIILAFASMVGTVLLAQQQVPDAPSATRPPPPSFPAGTKPAPANQSRPDSSSSDNKNDGNGTTQAAADPAESSSSLSDVKGPPRQRPRGTDDDGRDQFSISVGVNFVTVPVTVKDEDGRLVAGLLRKDFAIYEDGVPQPLKLFTSDPFPLSAALIIDQGMSDTAMKKINESLPAITGAFSQFDEVALYTYGDTVRRVSDFNAVSDQLTGQLRRTKNQGNTGGVPVVSGPLAAGPTVNGHPLDPGTPQVRTPLKQDRVLNDAVLRAALDLSKRDQEAALDPSKRKQARRKIIFIISDGTEWGSNASYNDVLKVLLSHEIAVYAIGVDSAAIPGYNKATRLHLPLMAYGNILPKYASATGGELFAEFTRKAIEEAYARVTEVARNQYTLGYTTRATPASNYRMIEVRVKRPGLKVYAKDGYYPLPPQRMNP